jgi:uncharacterized protein DUF6893
MKEIRISPKAQLIALLGLAGAITAAVAAQAPEIKRYLKIESM